MSSRFHYDCTAQGCSSTVFLRCTLGKYVSLELLVLQGSNSVEFGKNYLMMLSLEFSVFSLLKVK